MLRLCSTMLIRPLSQKSTPHLCLRLTMFRYCLSFWAFEAASVAALSSTTGVGPRSKGGFGLFPLSPTLILAATCWLCRVKYSKRGRGITESRREACCVRARGTPLIGSNERMAAGLSTIPWISCRFDAHLGNLHLFNKKRAARRYVLIYSVCLIAVPCFFTRVCTPRLSPFFVQAAGFTGGKKKKEGNGLLLPI